ncbi:MAG: thiol:disulfide interchange protein DsbD, partial [Gammaproteobacteria bacterium]|nr:thiol:disulfide interchange protein DsbD [Gammaproteobacteria bacterium]
MTLTYRRMPLFLAAFVLLTGPLLAGMAEARASTGIETALGAGKASTSEPDFLSPDEAFHFSALADGPDKIRLIWGITDGYYLYRARIKASSDGDSAKLGELVLPTGETKVDEYFGKQEVYHHDIVGSISVARSGVGQLAVPLKITYQGCATAGLCYPPITKTVSVVLPPAGAGSETGAANTAGASTATSTSAANNANAAATAGAFVAEQDSLATFLRDGNLVLVLITFFGIGALLSLTPCVLPMIPILSGLIVGQGATVTAKRGFSLAFTYVQGMALTYATAGAAFVLVFKQAPQAFFQQPWIIVLFAALFVAMALAMFGAFTLQMPSALQTRLTDVSNRQKAGSYVGCFVMGALSALVVTACVAPALIASLTVIS